MNTRLLPAYLLTFVNVLGFSILMPVLPFIVKDLGGEKWVYGLLLTFYSLFQFIGAPYLGAMSDQRGRKPVLIISQAGTLISWIIFFIALSVPNYFVYGVSLSLAIIGLSRILDGITGGNTSVANAYVSDITTKEEKSYIFGYLGGIAGLGMIIGPGIGGFAAATSLGYAGTILTAAIISLITLISLKLFLKESLSKQDRNKQQKQSLLKGVLLLRRVREVQPSQLIKHIFLVKLLFSIMMAFYISTIALFIIDLFEFNESDMGLFFLIVGIFLAFNQAYLSKRFIQRFGEFKTLLIGLFLCFIGLICITLTDNIILYFLFYYFLNLGLSLCFPTFNAIISVNANPKKQGEIMGISEGINSLAMALFPVIGAAAYGQFGHFVYYFVAILPLTGLLLSLVFLRKKCK